MYLVKMEKISKKISKKNPEKNPKKYPKRIWIFFRIFLDGRSYYVTIISQDFLLNQKKYRITLCVSIEPYNTL